MSDSPSSSSWSSRIVGFCLAIFIGTLALYFAVQLLRSIVPVLVIGAIVVAAGWLAWQWRRRTSGW